MHDLHFADGFDGPDRVAFGLTAPELAVAAGGALAAWALAASALPLPLRSALATLVAATAAMAAWGRFQRRPMLQWAALGAMYLSRPHRGSIVLAVAGGPGPGAGAEPPAPASSEAPAEVPATAGDDDPPWARWLQEGTRRRAPTDVRRPVAGVTPPVASGARPAATPTVEAPAAEAAPAPQRRTLAGRIRAAALTVRDGATAPAICETADAVPRPGAMAPPAATGMNGVEEAMEELERRRDALRRPVPTLESPHRVPLVLLPGSLDSDGGAGSDDDDDDADLPEGREIDIPDVPAIIPLRRATSDRTPVVVEETAASWVAETPAQAPVFVGATRRIALFSLKGGTGRTTLATELACLLAANGRYRAGADHDDRPLRVRLLDLDLRASSLSVRLGIPSPTLWDYISRGAANPDVLDEHLVSHPSGVRALLGPPKPLATMSGAVQPEMVAAVVERLERDGAHFIFFDLGTTLDAVTTWALQAAHDVIVVLTPTASGVQDAYRTTEVLRRMGVGSRITYVVNRARGPVNFDEVMGDLHGRIAATIPWDPAVEDAENHHRSAALRGSGPAAAAFRALAAELYPALQQRTARSGIARLRGLWRG